MNNRHPERFNTDGSPRTIRFFDSTKGTMRGTFPPSAPEDGDSRQVVRSKVRTAVFNEITHRAFRLPRAIRRAVAKEARIG